METERLINYSAIASLSLVTTGIISLSSCLAKPTPLAPIGILAGMGAIVAGGVIDRKENPELSEYWQSFLGVCEMAGQTIMEAVKSEAPEVQEIVAQYLPPKIKKWSEALSESLTKDEWLKVFRKRSHVVVGPSKSGKTQYLLSLVADCFGDLQEGEKLLICDPDYGSSHEDSSPNFWHHLDPDRFILTEYDDIYRAIHGFHQEMEDRLTATRQGQNIPKPTWRLIVDEWIGFVSWLESELEKKEFDRFITIVGELLRRGLKQRVVIVLGTQNLYTTSCKLPQALIPEFNILLLGDGALSAKNLQYLRLKEGEDEVALTNSLASIRKLPGCKYAGIAQFAGDPAAVKVVPTLDTSRIRLVEPQESDPTQEWFDSLPQDFRDRFSSSAIEYAQKLSAGEATKKDSKLSALCKELGVEQRSANPQYQKLKEEWGLIVSASQI